MRKRAVFGLTAALLAALMIAAPADAQTAKKTAGMEIELEIYHMETLLDAYARQNRMPLPRHVGRVTPHHKKSREPEA